MWIHFCPSSSVASRGQAGPWTRSQRKKASGSAEAPFSPGHVLGAPDDHRRRKSSGTTHILMVGAAQS